MDEIWAAMDADLRALGGMTATASAPSGKTGVPPLESSSSRALLDRNLDDIWGSLDAELSGLGKKDDALSRPPLVTAGNEEQVLLSVKAQVYVLDGATSNWVLASTTVISVSIRHNPASNLFRILGMEDRQVRVNSLITSSLVFQKSSDVFGQWMDMTGALFGLNFASAQEAEQFSDCFRLASAGKRPDARPPVPPAVQLPPARNEVDQRKAERLAYRAQLRLRKEHAAQCTDLEVEWRKTLPKLYTCTICNQTIAAGESVLLPTCMHAVCRKDVTYLVQHNQPITCAICQVHEDARMPIAAHPLVEMASAPTATQVCKKCVDDDIEATVPAVFICNVCEWHLCDSHGKAHLGVPKFKAHNLRLLPPTSSSSLRCPTHMEPYNAYCGSCKRVACNHCLASTHPPSQAHAVVLLDDGFVRTARARVDASIKLARALATERVSRAADARLALADVFSRDKAIYEQMNQSFDALHRLLDRRAEILRQQLFVASNAEQDCLRACEAADGGGWRTVTLAADIASEAASDKLGASAPSVLALLEPAATERLRALVAAAKTDPIPAPTTVQFGCANGDALRAAVESFGELVFLAPPHVSQAFIPDSMSAKSGETK